ncbi:MAG: radical SAM protein [Planctomycetaceae bacterium]|nr:radical SAM protein [Planctomycetaceae bacterium]
MTDSQSADSAESPGKIFQDHSRLFDTNRFVYPVVSRRSEGVSIGVNLNPDKVCNFDCIYCQVDRRSESETRFVEMEALLSEIRDVLDTVTSGRLFAHPRFASTPPAYRRLNDIAFSGDGEPTTYRNFDEIIGQVAAIKQQLAADCRMVLITNASMFHREHVQRGLQIMDAHHGQIWAKLDAGTAEYYRLIERTTIPFQQILDNITLVAQRRPIVIQSLFMNVDGEPPSTAEITAWCDRLAEIVLAGGRIDLVQIYTVARQPAESFVTALTEHQLREIARRLVGKTSLQTAVYP